MEPDEPTNDAVLRATRGSCMQKKSKDSWVTCTLRGVGETAVGGHAGRFRVIFAAEFERDLRATEKFDTAAPRERP